MKIKSILLTLITVSSLGLITSSFAKTTKDDMTPPSLSQEINQIMGEHFSSLSTEIEQLFQKGFQLVNQQNYQADPNMPAVQAANTIQSTVVSGVRNPYEYLNAGPAQVASANAQTATQNSINNALKQFNYALRPVKNDDLSTNMKLYAANHLGFHQYVKDNSLAALSGVQANPSNDDSQSTPTYAADDTLYISAPDADNLYANNQQPGFIKKSQQPNNSMFNVATVLTPTVYTTSQLQNANDYVKFATQNSLYLFPKSKFDFYKLGAANLTAKQRATALYNLKQNPVYQQFKLNMRTAIAQQSVSTNIFNQLIAERAPTVALNTKTDAKMIKALGLTGSNPKASPLQIQSYIANHRTQDPNWYQSVQSASPATIQRKTLIVLAEIEHQNYEAHIDREKILAALAALNISSDQQKQQLFMEQASHQVNAAINAALPKSDQTTSSDNGANSEASAASAMKRYNQNNNNSAAAKKAQAAAKNDKK